MSNVPTSPGVFITEVSTDRTAIAGVPTANTAFVDVFERGPEHVPTAVRSFVEFTEVFGDIHPLSRASLGIWQYFANGGSLAWVVRVAGLKSSTASGSTPLGMVHAIGSGAWGNTIEVATEATPAGFNLVIRDVTPARGARPRQVRSVEIYRDVSRVPADPNSWVEMVNQQSRLIVASTAPPVPGPSVVPSVIVAADSITSPANARDLTSSKFHALGGGFDDFAIGPGDLGAPPNGSATPARGYHTLDALGLGQFNLLCIPAMAGFTDDEWASAFGPATDFCEQHRAFFIVDPPAHLLTGTATTQVSQLQQWFDGTAGTSGISGSTSVAAVYFPRLMIADPTASARAATVETEASGTVAGSYATTDATRGVWKAPAGAASSLRGVTAPAVAVDDRLNGVLNPLGINVIRTLPSVGTVNWGARTINGADHLADDYKYISVRRLANYIELSLQRGTTWAVFEPNNRDLWDRLRQAIEQFMHSLLAQGAFASSGKADSAFFVRCDASTTTFADQVNGRVNVVVGFAPIRPAEFVVITISHTTSQ